MTTPNLPQTTQKAWLGFLETFEPLRPQLYRYCRYLTRSPWDAEDLAQDTLARAFVTLAQMGGQGPANPRAWLFRVASNLWLDRVRHRREVPSELPEVAAAVVPDRAPREAAGTLLVKLTPQERAAVVLKDVFELSLEETAEALGTTVGAVKTALHRGRGKLGEEGAPETKATPAPGVLDAFCTAFNAGDLDRLASLLLDTSVVEVVGATTQYGPEAAKRTVLFGMLFGTKILADPAAKVGIAWSLREGALPEPPRIEARWHRGRWLLLSWYRHVDGEAVRAISTVETEGDRIARLENYFYTPEFLVDLCGELGVPVRVNGHRWWIGEEAACKPSA
jgi:RNA polymerase sigma-70 factor (ECF subfamily)